MPKLTIRQKAFNEIAIWHDARANELDDTIARLREARAYSMAEATEIARNVHLNSYLYCKKAGDL